VGLLCSRVRVEEKGILAALNGAGVPGCAVPPDQPLPAPLADATAPGVIVDRCADRTAAGVLLGLYAADGVETIDAGLAARRDRVEIMLALRAAGLPVPQMRVGIGEDAALAVVTSNGPQTLMPMTPGQTGVTLWDSDTAEAVLEHRSVLGGRSENVFVLFGGAPTAGERVLLTVVGGNVAGIETPMAELPAATEANHLACRAAFALRAPLVGVELAWTAAGWVIWNIVPVPDFRAAVPTGEVSVAGAIAALAGTRAATHDGTATGLDIVALQRVSAGGVIDEFAATI
jgi:hypothetical protein